MAQPAATPGQTVARVNGTVPRLSVAAGRKGFKAELEELRERMRGLGLGHGEVAAKVRSWPSTGRSQSHRNPTAAPYSRAPHESGS